MITTQKVKVKLITAQQARELADKANLPKILEVEEKALPLIALLINKEALKGKTKVDFFYGNDNWTQLEPLLNLAGEFPIGPQSTELGRLLTAQGYVYSHHSPKYLVISWCW